MQNQTSKTAPDQKKARSQTVMPIAAAVVIVGAGLYMSLGRSKANDVSSENPLVQHRKSELAKLQAGVVLDSSTRQNTTGTLDSSDLKLSAKMKINASLLAKLNPAIANANPGIDFDKLTDEQLAKLKIPKDIPLVVLRDTGCGSQGAAAIGEVGENMMGEKFSRLDSPKFVSVTTTKDQTLGDLSNEMDADKCSLALIPNGELKKIGINDKQALKAKLEKSESGIKYYDFKEAFESGRQIVETSIIQGRPQALQIYLTGAPASSWGVTTGTDSSAAIPAASLAGGSGEVFLLPLSESSSAGNQIADVNNAVINAIASGADFVAVPPVDPSVYEAAAQIAKENGVTIYEIPTGTELVPTSIVDGASRMPASEQAQ